MKLLKPFLPWFTRLISHNFKRKTFSGKIVPIMVFGQCSNLLLADDEGLSLTILCKKNEAHLHSTVQTFTISHHNTVANKRWVVKEFLKHFNKFSGWKTTFNNSEVLIFWCFNVFTLIHVITTFAHCVWGYEIQVPQPLKLLEQNIWGLKTPSYFSWYQDFSYSRGLLMNSIIQLEQPKWFQNMAWFLS